jgi:hypothetical protein
MPIGLDALMPSLAVGVSLAGVPSVIIELEMGATGSM